MERLQIFVYVVLLCQFLTCLCGGATVVKARQRLKRSNIQKSSRLATRTANEFSLRNVMDFNDQVDFSRVIQKQTVQGNSVIKYAETVNGKTVYDTSIVAMFDKDGVGIDVSGEFYEDLHEHLLEAERTLNHSQALAIAFTFNNHSLANATRIRNKQDIFVDKNGVSYLAYFIDYFTIVDEGPSRPFTVVDSKTGEILLHVNHLESCNYSAKSYGGNIKIGRIDYGKLSNCLNIKRYKNMCSLENEYVRVIDMNSTIDENITDSVTFQCNESYTDSVNGAYSPAFDALFYGTTVAKMLSDWYGISNSEQHLLRVHYSTNLTDAFWDGRYCSFGDGNADKYFPMVSLDVVAHEIGHSITEKYSDLLYMGQSGGINEAFSDLTGEVAEYYMGSVDWMVGYDITRGESPVRYFRDPSLDNSSITHMKDYYDGMRTHISSGIFRKIFYLLVKKYKISMRKVYQVFLHANQLYWHKMSSFVTAACDILRAALDLGSSVTRFSKAFQKVGIQPCNINDHIFWLRGGEIYSDIFVSSNTEPIFGFSTPPWASNLTVKVISASPILITLYHAGSLTEHDYYVLKTDSNKLQIDIVGNVSRHYFIQLSSNSKQIQTDIKLTVGYECKDIFKTLNLIHLLNYRRDCYSRR